jgi:hypothetical protein
MSNKKIMNELKESIKFLSKHYQPAPQVGIVPEAAKQAEPKSATIFKELLAAI